MSGSYGDDVDTSPLTARDQAWPCLRQFSVVLENRVGKLHELFLLLEKNDLTIIAMSVIDSADFSTVRLMVNNADRARELFKLNGMTFLETDVLGIVLPEETQPLIKICIALMQVEMNIHYMYPLLYRSGRQGAIAIHVDNIDLATTTLKKKGHQLISESDLQMDDEFF
jgi:hypothetical protein